MSALFDFSSFLTVVLLFICTCTYYKLLNPGGLTQQTGCAPLQQLPAAWTPIPRPHRPGRRVLCALSHTACCLPLFRIACCRFRGLFWKAARIGEVRRSAGRGARQAAGKLGSGCRGWPPTTHPRTPAGERLSPWVGIACVAMGLSILFA